MAEVARGVDAAVVKVRDGVRVDLGREREGVADEAVFEFGNEVRLPAEALDLPCAEGEGCDGDQGEDDEAWAVAVSCADELGGVVDYGVEVWGRFGGVGAGGGVEFAGCWCAW